MNLWRSFRMLSTLSRDRFIADLPYTITSNLGERQFGFKCTHTDWSSSLALPGSLQSIHPYFVIPARNPSAILYFNRFPIKRPPPSSNALANIFQKNISFRLRRALERALRGGEIAAFKQRSQVSAHRIIFSSQLAVTDARSLARSRWIF